MAIIRILILVVTLLAACNAANLTNASDFSSILIFGDSTVDTGNNNFINTFFKGNHFPYGQDFLGRVPSGRFSNGKLIPDFAASELGIKDTVPPFLDPLLSDKDLLTGVSFASAGSGYDELTTFASRVIPVSKQTEMFQHYITRLNKIVGEDKAKKIINESLVILSAGTNDFVFNFYGLPTRQFEFDITGYQDFILKKLQNFVQELYNMGCRKMVVAGIPPIGCLPIQMTATIQNPFNRRCIETQNSESQAYNVKLQKLLSELHSNLTGSLILYADIYNPLLDMMTNSHKYGLTETKSGCCGSGFLEASFLCNSLTPTCPNHNEFMFWDSIHPTQTTYHYLTQHLVKDLLEKLHKAQ